MSFVNVCIAGATRKQFVTLPRELSMTDLQKLAPRNAALTVDGCTPANATTLGDLYDLCAKLDTLEVRCVIDHRMGCNAGCCASSLAEDKQSRADRIQSNVIENVLGPGATADDFANAVAKGAVSSAIGGSGISGLL